MTDFSLFKTYGPGQPIQFDRPSDFTVELQVWSEQWLDGLPLRLIAGGMTCQQARDYITANIATILGRCIVRRDTVIDGFSAFVNPVDGAGSPPDYGNAYTRFPANDNLVPPADYSATTFFAGFPDLINVTVNGDWDIFSVKTFAAYASTNPGTPPHDYGAWLPTVERIIEIDINRWFCNVTQCCGVPIPVGGASSFLMPKADMPSPVEENSSTPLIKTPVYLANHTWAFKNNFGRLPK